MTDTTPIADLLNELAYAIDAQSSAQKALDAVLESNPERLAVDAAAQNVKQLRSVVEERLRADGTKTVSTDRLRATMVTRHDYKIKDQSTFHVQASRDGLAGEWLIWDMKAIAKYASAYRKSNDENYPGIIDVPKSFLEVTPL